MGKGNFGYHTRAIKKGVLGELSKIQEELEEAEDAVRQNGRVLHLCELADLYGALEAHLKAKFPTWKMKDLKKMSRMTRRSFRRGERR